MRDDLFNRLIEKGYLELQKEQKCEIIRQIRNSFTQLVEQTKDSKVVVRRFIEYLDNIELDSRGY